MNAPARQGLGFPLQLAMATLVIGGVVAGLSWLGSQRSAVDNVAPPRALAVKAPASARASDAVAVTARSLLPAEAWLVADFDGQLTGESPFAERMAGPCAKIPAPRRVAVAVLPTNDTPQAVGDGVDLLLVAPSVTSDFWRCIEERVLRSGGKALATGGPGEALASASGVVLHGPLGQLIFATSERLLPTMLALLSGGAANAESGGAHHELALRLGGAADSYGPERPALVLTLHLPTDWLTAAGEEALRSPLRHLTAATLIAKEDGGAAGTLHCLEPGCEELAAFLLRARGDLANGLPPEIRGEVVRALDARLTSALPDGTGTISLSWASPVLPFSRLATLLWRGLPR